jgi:protein Tex
VKDPSEVVKVQQKVEVTVMEVDLDRKRIALSMRKGAVAGQKPAESRTGPVAARPEQPAAAPRPTPKPAAKPAGEGWFSAALKEAKKK